MAALLLFLKQFFANVLFNFSIGIANIINLYCMNCHTFK